MSDEVVNARVHAGDIAPTLRDVLAMKFLDLTVGKVSSKGWDNHDYDRWMVQLTEASTDVLVAAYKFADRMLVVRDETKDQ